MRKLIAGMKVTVDGKFGNPDGYAYWVDAWSNDYGITSKIDACILGGGMYPGYEHYWSTIQAAPNSILPMTEKLPTPDEIEWANFAQKTPHYVLSNTINSASWPNTHFLHDIQEIKTLKNQPGKDIYLVGGAETTTSLINANLVDELHLIVYPLIDGNAKPLFSSLSGNHKLELQSVRSNDKGCIHMIYHFKT